MSWSLWLAFLAAALVIAVSPGPGAVLSMSTGLRYGFGAALRSIAGLELALLLQLGVVALGLGAVLATSELAFTAVKFAGAAYLVWIGVHKWRAAPEPLGEGEVRAHSRRQLYAQGLLVNLTNPKAIVFFLAFTPQFIRLDADLLTQYAIFTITVVTIDVIVMWFFFALAAKGLRRFMREDGGQRFVNRIFGTLFVLVAGLLVFID